ncbi:MAG: ectoine/hydroxyectoine ABC transporter substrate-binding protein EhuB [Nocardioidaceae bacterium]
MHARVARPHAVDISEGIDMAEGHWTRRDVLRSVMMAGAVVAAPPVLGGCAALGFGDTLEGVRSDGTIRVGIAGEVPYSFLDEKGTLVGGIGALHRAVWARIGNITVRPVVVPFGELLDGLDAGNFDAVAAGMFITSQRCDQAVFSEPVYCAPSSLLVAKGNPQRLRDYQSVADADASLAVLGSAVEVDYARASGVDNSRLQTVGSQNEGLRLVASGQVDAFALTHLSLRSLLDRAGRIPDTQDLPGVEPTPGAVDQVELVDPFVPVVDGQELLGCGAAAFRSNDTELRDAFSDELAALRRSGDLLRLMQPWGFTETELPPPGVTAADLCRIGGVSGTDYDPVPR